MTAQPRLSREGLLLVSGGPSPSQLPGRSSLLHPATAFSSLSRLLQRVLGEQWPEQHRAARVRSSHLGTTCSGKGQPPTREAAPSHPLRALEMRALGQPRAELFTSRDAVVEAPQH